MNLSIKFCFKSQTKPDPPLAWHSPYINSGGTRPNRRLELRLSQKTLGQFLWAQQSLSNIHYRYKHLSNYKILEVVNVNIVVCICVLLGSQGVMFQVFCLVNNIRNKEEQTPLNKLHNKQHLYLNYINKRVASTCNLMKVTLQLLKKFIESFKIYLKQLWRKIK